MDGEEINLGATGFLEKQKLQHGFEGWVEFDGEGVTPHWVGKSHAGWLQWVFLSLYSSLWIKGLYVVKPWV